jgi:hypothetical protein
MRFNSARNSPAISAKLPMVAAFNPENPEKGLL